MTVMASPYREVLAVPGAVLFSATGLLARLPLSMAGIGIVILVATRTGSYSYAGGVAAAYVAANAIVAVPLARLVDRLGQRRVLGPAATVSAAGVAMLVLAVENGWPTPLPHVCAVVGGAALPNVGAAVRARWSHALEDRSLVDTAFAVEAVNDEIVFMVGPIAVTVLATLVHPWAGLAAAATAALVGTWLLVAQHRTEPPAHASLAPDPDTAAVPAPAMPWSGLVPLVLGAAMLGVLFGGTEVAVVAFTDEQGQQATAGLLLALWALGSLLAGAVVGGLRFRRSAAERYRWGALSLATLMTPLPFLSSVVPMAGVLFLAGFAISPTLIAAVTWVESIVPQRRLNEGITAVSTGLIAGVAPGAALVGAAVDRWGASTSFAIPAAAGFAAFAVALLAATRTQSPRAGLTRITGGS